MDLTKLSDDELNSMIVKSSGKFNGDLTTISDNVLDNMIKEKMGESKQNYQQQVRTLLPRMSSEIFKPALSDVSPMDLITGVAPYKTMQNVYTGIKDVAIPQRKTSPLLRFATDIALAPETYIGGVPLAKKALMPTGEAGALAKTGAFIAGVDKETLAKTAKIGYRNVLNKKYYNAKIPEILANRIENNVANLEKAAKTEFDIITNPLKDIPFSFKELKNQILTLARQLRTNPFKGPSKDLNMNIIDGISKAKVKNIGDVLDLRRNLDEVLYTAKGQGVKSSFGKAVRDKFNEILHQNDILKSADEMWTSLQNILRDNKRVIGETGESYLKRWATLTAKQKNALVLLEKKSGGEPFVQDLTNWSLSKEFLAKPGIRGGLFNAIQKTAHPLLRAGLRAGGALEKGKQLLFRKP